MDKISRSEYEVAQHQVEAQQNTQEGISTGGTDAVGDGQSEAALRILENDLSSIGLDEDSSDEKEFELPLFDSRQCLFCNVQSEVFENNLEHMLKKQ